jgi:hypothetical protein
MPVEREESSGMSVAHVLASASLVDVAHFWTIK